MIVLTAYVLASLLCVVAPSIYVLIALRLVQGTAGAAGIVIARAIVRDKYTGIEVARFFSTLMLVSGVAPIATPIIGGLLLQVTSWRGVFILLAIVVTLLLLAVITRLGETLPPERRQSGELRVTLSTFRRLLTDRAFM
jgi:DHA1 family bicyclomycin/chloramphenicol resistance-like MFS transporter